MKNPFAVTSVACAATLLLGLATTSSAEEPFPAPQSSTTAATHPDMFDREGKRIIGYELMSDTERAGYRALLFSIKDPAAREEARAAHRKAMEKRAAERGVKLQE